MRFLHLIAVLLALGALGHAQEFEVATVRVSDPLVPGQRRIVGGGISGGPGTPDPTRFHCGACTFSALILQAYDVQRVQVDFPSWMDQQRFDVTAKVPDGATKEQMHVMLRHLLAERFKLVVHHETREVPILELKVGKDGPKFKEGDPNSLVAPPQEMLNRQSEKDKDGFVKVPPNTMIIESSGTGSRARLNSVGETMDWLAARLANVVRKPVINKTGLTGKYDYMLTWAPDTAAMGAMPPPGREGNDTSPGPLNPEGPTLDGALKSQLGLILESRKGPVDMLVIDHAEKTPTEN